MSNKAGYDSLEKLRKKVTHDIEHQIKELLKLRDFVAKKVHIETGGIEVPVLVASKDCTVCETDPVV
jgi:hypothetical protein